MSLRDQQQQQRQQPNTIIEKDDPNFERKIDAITAGARPFVKDHLLHRITRENCLTIVAYMLAMHTEVSPSQTYRLDTIMKLSHFAVFYNPKSFKDITRQNVIDFLDKYRKSELQDPMHCWIGTYESHRIILLRFFKWLYAPDIEAKNRPKPPVMENIPRIIRKETSIYKPTDLWTAEDDALFYKYCPSPRDRCWHAVARDTGCRPHEMLRMKIKDVIVQRLDLGHHIARITVNGKTGMRHVRLNNSYPWFKDWLTNGHPFPNIPDAPLFCGVGRKNMGRRLTSGHAGISAMYDRYKKRDFPRLLQDPVVPEEDKRKIQDLLQKKWNPYVRRHTAATEISKALKDPVLIDRVMGWSPRGNTRQKYQHYYADDGFDALLTVMDGLNPTSNPNTKGKKNPLKPIQCPYCDETNKPESKFCAKCKFALTFDAFNETLQEKDKLREETKQMQAQIDIMAANMSSLMKFISTQGKEPLDLITTDVKGLKYRNEEEERKALLQMGEVAREKRKKIGQVNLELDNVKVKNE